MGSFHQSVSHVPCRNWNLCRTFFIGVASKVSQKGFPSGEAGPKGLIGRKWNPAAKGRSMVRLPLGELSPEAAEGRIRPFDHCHSFCFSSFLPGSFPTGSSPHPLSAELPFRGEPSHVWIETIGMGSFHQSVSHVPAVIDELTRLRFAPAPSQHLRGW